jgi:hypothetical protein
MITSHIPDDMRLPETSYPCSPGGMLILVEDSAQTLVPSDAQAGGLVRADDRWR